LAVQHAGATPVLADVDANNWQLTPQTARAIAAKMPVHAVMPVAVYGAPVLAAEWDAFSEETGIPVIIDAAAALESQDIPQRCLLAHSLHATKPFSVGEGGILISRRAEWIAEARRISNFGMHMRIAQEDGSNAKMSEYHGAVALAQLERWEGIKQRRRKVFEFYRDALKKLAPGFALQPGAAQAIISVFMLQAPDGKSAFAIVDHLNTLGIAAHRMYLPPLYQHPHFAKLAVVDQAGRALPGDAPAERKTALMVNSERMNRSVFGLPFHAFMNETDVAQVLCALADAAK
jgi:dTDP-4-amino-4,6-dideoxygalactose transaminase